MWRKHSEEKSSEQKIVEGKNSEKKDEISKWTAKHLILNYAPCNIYTADLFDALMAYKQLWKQIDRSKFFVRNAYNRTDIRFSHAGPDEVEDEGAPKDHRAHSGDQAESRQTANDVLYDCSAERLVALKCTARCKWYFSRHERASPIRQPPETVHLQR